MPGFSGAVLSGVFKTEWEGSISEPMVELLSKANKTRKGLVYCLGAGSNAVLQQGWMDGPA